LQKSLAAVKERKEQLAWELMSMRNSFMHSESASKNGTFPEFQPQPGDVVISTYPKCGTTWMMQIVHGLRSKGDMNFDEITEVSPWDICAELAGWDLNAPQGFTPRMFKSHEPFEKVGKSKGTAREDVGEAKYIYVMRDPADAFVSFWHFMPSYMGLLPGDISATTFCDAIFAGTSCAGTIWSHMLGWYPVRQHPNVLFIHFETLLENLEEQVALVSKFLGIQLPPPDFQKVLKQATHKWMSHPDNHRFFDDHILWAAVKERSHMPESAQFKVGKVRKGGGKTGESKALPAHVTNRLHEMWKATVQKQLGFQDYTELRKHVERENKARFTTNGTK